MVLSPQPKVKPGKRMRTRKSMQQATDRRESALVRTRSGGRCEVAIEYFSGDAWTGAERCHRRAVHVHHRLSGRGVRGIGASALAVNKLAVCEICHDDIHRKRLIPVGDKFERRTAA